jgi:ABC-type multidrug transport system ATPase subunit
MALAGSSIALWDNSSRGLDSSMAFEFVKHLRIASDVSGITYAVAIYQASQGVFDLFDKVLVLYEGRQSTLDPQIWPEDILHEWVIIARPGKQLQISSLLSPIPKSELFVKDSKIASLDHRMSLRDIGNFPMSAKHVYEISKM